jgi:hypothetical protein
MNKRIFGYKRTFPNRIQYFLFLDHSPAVFNQEDKRLQGLRGQAHSFLPSIQASANNVEGKVPKMEQLILSVLVGLVHGLLKAQAVSAVP